MNEKEMREAEVPRIGSLEELTQYVDGLVKQGHDYGTCVYAMSMSAVAAFNYVAGVLGVTGFQAACADMDIIRRTRGWESGFRILNYENLMYPQYLNAESFPGVKELLKENRVHLAKLARERMKEAGPVHPEVKKHWEWLVRQATEEELTDEKAQQDD